jgi:hypothetical protein
MDYPEFFSKISLPSMAKHACIQRTVEEDVKTMGLQNEYDQISKNSKTALNLIQSADKAGVKVQWGGNHPKTALAQGK